MIFQIYSILYLELQRGTHSRDWLGVILQPEASLTVPYVLALYDVLPLGKGHLTCYKYLLLSGSNPADCSQVVIVSLPGTLAVQSCFFALMGMSETLSHSETLGHM